jgi:adenosylcobinamide-GDP ribazoletransferase
VLACGWSGLALVAVSAGLAAASGAYYRRRIGGVTGDCMGATCQLAECAVYLTGVLL